ncbi:MAG TPA: transaldolase [Gemmatimonadaceae bacterium]|nr:transaldolase [Gemmatimonadaceae bacterium]
MATNRLKELHDAGQSVWLDYIDRTMLRNGDLQRRIREDCITGMTSNPTIFEKALAEGTAYDEQLGGASGDFTAFELFELVAADDVQAACEIFGDTFLRTRGADGFVSIEVAPGIEHDAAATVETARRLWRAVDRPNVMVKVPGTDAGVDAVRQLIAEGVNVNITLLFSIDSHRKFIQAYLDGLEARARAGNPLDHVSSVASFFVSRVDSEVDKRLDAIAGPDRERAQRLKGKAAIANAKLAYQLFLESFRGPRWDALAARGARVQRPLWASTSTKNPAYRDVMYVEDLIGPDTVNTMPPATVEAFRDHGVVARTVDTHIDQERKLIAELKSLGIDLKDVTDKLLVDGLASFQKSYDALLKGLEGKTTKLGRELARR